MIELLFMVVFGEMLLILLLLFKTPLRKLEIMALDRLKRGRGPLIVKSVASTVLVIMLYTVYAIAELQSRPLETLSHVDQILLSHHLLEASLMGFALFLSFMIDKLHHYIRELRLLRKTMEAAKQQSRGLDDGKSDDGVKSLEEEVAKLRKKMKKVESECEAKGKEAKSAEANSTSLTNQSESLLLEYDRLLEENQHLRSQLQSIDRNSSSSNDKKST